MVKLSTYLQKNHHGDIFKKKHHGESIWTILDPSNWFLPYLLGLCIQEWWIKFWSPPLAHSHCNKWHPNSMKHGNISMLWAGAGFCMKHMMSYDIKLYISRYTIEIPRMPSNTIATLILQGRLRREPQLKLISRHIQLPKSFQVHWSKLHLPPQTYPLLFSAVHF